MTGLGEIPRTGRILFELALVGSHSGNMSVRARDRIIITRHDAMLGFLTDRDLVRVPLSPTLSRRGRGGNLLPRTLRGTGKLNAAAPSMDVEIHRAIYAATDAEAIVHAHPVHAVALSLDRREIVPSDVEGIYHLKRVPVVGSAGAASYRAMPRLLPDALRRSRIAVMRGHGSYAIGKTLEEALHLTSALEFSAAVLTLAVSAPPVLGMARRAASAAPSMAGPRRPMI